MGPFASMTQRKGLCHGNHGIGQIFIGEVIRPCVTIQMEAKRVRSRENIGITHHSSLARALLDLRGQAQKDLSLP